MRLGRGILLRRRYTAPRLYSEKAPELDICIRDTTGMLAGALPSESAACANTPRIVCPIHVPGELLGAVAIGPRLAPSSYSPSDCEFVGDIVTALVHIFNSERLAARFAARMNQTERIRLELGRPSPASITIANAAAPEPWAAETSSISPALSQAMSKAR